MGDKPAGVTVTDIINLVAEYAPLLVRDPLGLAGLYFQAGQSISITDDQGRITSERWARLNDCVANLQTEGDPP